MGNTILAEHSDRIDENETQIPRAGPAVGTKGQLPTFDGQVSHWRVYLRKLRNYFHTNNTSPHIQSRILLNGLSYDAYGRMCDLCDPEEHESVIRRLNYPVSQILPAHS